VQCSSRFEQRRRGRRLPQPLTNHSGSYSVIVSNAIGVLTSSNAAVSVLSSPPFFLTHPVGGTNIGLSAADTVGFSVLATANLVDWDPLTNTLTPINGLLLIQDPTATKFPQRFYRVIEHP
jgi:hypothetical protein